MVEKKDMIVLGKFKEKLDRDFPVEKIILFGSKSRGEVHEWSDFDLIIVSSGFNGMDFSRRGAKMYDYWDCNYPVDFLCYTPDEFNKLKRMITIVREAVRTGIVVE